MFLPQEKKEKIGRKEKGREEEKIQHSFITFIGNEPWVIMRSLSPIP